MPSFAELIQQSSAHAWLFIPSAILLGALHGLEPGHSKTMMAAFIVAIRGTVMQAIVLGLAATVSHTAIVWAIALGGLWLGASWNTEATEPYLQLVSAVLIIGVAVWMVRRTWRQQRAHARHHHGDDTHTIDTGHGHLTLSVFEDGVPPRWRVNFMRGETFPAGDVSLETVRPDGSRQSFYFASRDGYLESIEEIPEPHAFTARLRLSHGGHAHSYDVEFHEHKHDHEHAEPAGIDVGVDGNSDAHERAHAEQIRRRFGNRDVTLGQIIMFGLTGGLLPCPASVTVLLLCLQLKQFTLGFVLVLCFSFGLAITLVSVGAAAALSTRYVSKRWSWFGNFARRAPYFSSVLIIAVGIYVGLQGWAGLSAYAASTVHLGMDQDFRGSHPKDCVGMGAEPDAPRCGFAEQRIERDARLVAGKLIDPDQHAVELQ
jgi:nickel/cobalt exporter